jgi:hypothetical protein
MGIAVSGMHYTGMAAVSVHLHDTTSAVGDGGSAYSILLPMLIGPVIFLLLAAVVVMFDPLLVLGDGDRTRSAGRRRAPAPPASPVAEPGSLFDPAADPASLVEAQSDAGRRVYNEGVSARHKW